MPPRPWTLLSFALVAQVGGCRHRDTAACLERQRAVGIEGSRATMLCTRPCAELAATFGVDAERCRQWQEGGPVSAPSGPASALAEPRGPNAAATDARADRSARCDAYVAFAFGCGIGRPPRDPTITPSVQLSNDLVAQQYLASQCRHAPYDEALFRCFDPTRPDCARYRACVTDLGADAAP